MSVSLETLQKKKRKNHDPDFTFKLEDEIKNYPSLTIKEYSLRLMRDDSVVAKHADKLLRLGRVRREHSVGPNRRLAYRWYPRETI